MKPDKLEKIINEAFENKQSVSENSDKKILDAIKETIELTDKGNIRVAEKKNGKWSVNQWVKKAILLSFRVNKMKISNKISNIAPDKNKNIILYFSFL